MTIIFTDGAARGNPGPGGWGAIVSTDEKVYELGGREEHTTNNRMELSAVIAALESVSHEVEITLYTDSAYVLNGITRWVKGWQKNNWKTSTKDDVVNRDLWEKLVDATSHKVIDWKLVKGHAGTPANERCDVIATSFADQGPINLYDGAKSEYPVSLEVGEKNSGVSNSKSKSKSKAYSYVSMVDDKIMVHKTWEECKKRVSGVSGAKFKKSVSPADEEEIIRQFGE